MGRGARREPEARQGRIPGLSAPVDRLDLPWNTCVAMNVVCPLGVGLPRSVAGWGDCWVEMEGAKEVEIMGSPGGKEVEERKSLQQAV